MSGQEMQMAAMQAQGMHSQTPVNPLPYPQIAIPQNPVGYAGQPGDTSWMNKMLGNRDFQQLLASTGQQMKQQPQPQGMLAAPAVMPVAPMQAGQIAPNMPGLLHRGRYT